jgi:hypothetical protein
MAKWCLPKKQAEEFLNRIKNGQVTLEKLYSLKSTADRRAFFEPLVGAENAKQLNTMFEQKLLLKDQERAMVNFVKEAVGLKEPIKRDMVEKIKKMDKLLSADEAETFLADLIEKKLGFEVTIEEANTLAEYSQKIELAKEKWIADKTFENQIEMGRRMVEMKEYIRSINPPNVGAKAVALNIAGTPRGLMASGDFSYAFIQGWGMMSRPQFWTSLGHSFEYWWSAEKYKDLQAEVVSDPLFPFAQRGGLRITVEGGKLFQKEEAFQSTVVEHIPILRNSERAYVGFLNKLRFDVFKHLLRLEELRGGNINDTATLQEIARAVNDFTGSGNIGTNDKYGNVVPLLNTGFWSIRNYSATVNMLNPVNYFKGNKTARQARWRQMIGSLAMTAMVLGLYQAFNDEKVIELDPRSTRFGKIKIGKNWYNLSGGKGGWVTLAAKLATNKAKSAGGKIYELGKGYKADSRADIIVKFGRNKLSPGVSLLWDFLDGEDAIGNKFNWSDAIRERMTPMVAGDIIDLAMEDPSYLILGTILDLFGITP